MIHNFFIEPDQNIPQPRQDGSGQAEAPRVSTSGEKGGELVLSQYEGAMGIFEGLYEQEPANIQEENENE